MKGEQEQHGHREREHQGEEAARQADAGDVPEPARGHAEHPEQEQELDPHVESLGAQRGRQPQGWEAQEREQVLREALMAARSIIDKEARAGSLLSLLSVLPKSCVSDVSQELTELVHSMEEGKASRSVLAELALQLAQLDRPSEALAVARSIEDEEDRAQSLLSLLAIFTVILPKIMKKP